MTLLEFLNAPVTFGDLLLMIPAAALGWVLGGELLDYLQRRK